MLSHNKSRIKLNIVNPKNIYKSLYTHRELIWNLTKKDIKSTYQGSFLGVLWTILPSLLMLLVYTFVFSVIFQARWTSTSNTAQVAQGEFALILFAGLTPFTLFSTVINRSPTLILSVPNYVKKVVFPVEILPIVITGSALFTSFINICLILIGSLFIYKGISINFWMLPFAYFPLLLFTLGLSWLISSLGVFIRDVGQIITIVVQILFFMSPIFYSLDLIPDNLQFLFRLNPLSYMIDFFRHTLIWNNQFSWFEWAWITLFSGGIALLGYLWFSITKKGFADVM